MTPGIAQARTCPNSFLSVPGRAAPEIPSGHPGAASTPDVLLPRHVRTPPRSVPPRAPRPCRVIPPCGAAQPDRMSNARRDLWRTSDGHRTRSTIPMGSAPTLDLSHEDARRLTALCRCAATDKNRPVLMGVNFRDGAAWATDSYVAGTVPLAGLPKKINRLVPAAVLKGALSRVGKKDSATVTFGAERITVRIEHPTLLGTPNETHDVEYIDGKFPNLSGLLSAAEARGPSSEPAWFAPHLLTRLAALAARNTPVQLVATGTEQAALVMADDGAVLGAIMPMRLPESIRSRRRAA